MMTNSGNPQTKIVITHGGADYTYISDQTFTSIMVKRRENNYDTATLQANDEYGELHSLLSVFDEAKIYMRDSSESAWTQIFGGHIRQSNPSVATSATLQLLCKGYAAALEETHCNRDYGAESSNPTLDTQQEIIQDLVDNMINKSLGTAAGTGYNIGKTKIAAVTATTIKYVNNPYRANIEVTDIIAQLTSAIGAGANPGAHWIVDHNKNLLFDTISNHTHTTEWPNWWNTDQAGSTLTQDVDFLDFQVLDKAEEFANKVLLVTDFRRPTYDYWTEDSGGAALWGNEGFTGITNESATGYYVVGSHSLKFDPDGATTGYGYFPSSANAAWNVNAWGSEKTIPRLNFYCRKKNLTTTTTYVYLSTNTTARKTDYFYATFLNWQTEADDTWFFKSIPIGPYWASTEEAKQFRWDTVGSPSWSNIGSLEFVVSLGGADATLHIDDLHFSGKLARSAKNSTNITANKEHQKVLISRNAMDDSCVASDDTGYAARIAYAELLRRQSLPVTVMFTVAGKQSMMAGQKLHVHAGKKRDGASYTVDADMRIIELAHKISGGNGFTTTVTATSDLKNSSPVNIPDQYAMWQENMFVNSAEAKNIRAGAEVDLLIPMIEKDYPS